MVNYLFVLISFIKGAYLNLSLFSVLCENILIYSVITALFWLSKISKPLHNEIQMKIFKIDFLAKVIRNCIAGTRVGLVCGRLDALSYQC